VPTTPVPTTPVPTTPVPTTPVPTTPVPTTPVPTTPLPTTGLPTPTISGTLLCTAGAGRRCRASGRSTHRPSLRYGSVCPISLTRAGPAQGHRTASAITGCQVTTTWAAGAHRARKRTVRSAHVTQRGRHEAAEAGHVVLAGFHPGGDHGRAAGGWLGAG
jgi:hypothetical protein